MDFNPDVIIDMMMHTAPFIDVIRTVGRLQNVCADPTNIFAYGELATLLWWMQQYVDIDNHIIIQSININNLLEAMADVDIPPEETVTDALQLYFKQPIQEPVQHATSRIRTIFQPHQKPNKIFQITLKLNEGWEFFPIVHAQFMASIQNIEKQQAKIVTEGDPQEKINTYLQAAKELRNIPQSAIPLKLTRTLKNDADLMNQWLRTGNEEIRQGRSDFTDFIYDLDQLIERPVFERNDERANEAAKYWSRALALSFPEIGK
jgi:hypothetical protein